MAQRPSRTGQLRSVPGTPIQLRRVVPYFGQSRPSILIEFDDAAAVGGESKFAAAEFNSRQEVHAGGNAVHNRRLAQRVEDEQQAAVSRMVASTPAGMSAMSGTIPAGAST